MIEDDNTSELSILTANIVAAFATNNKLSGEDLAQLIGATYGALKTAGEPTPETPQTPKPDKAAVRRSVSPEHLVSFVDGRKYKSLKRHLTTNGMTPAQYRETYGLPHDYPMVAPSYSAQRSELARSLGLGRKPGQTAAAAPAAKTGDAKPKGRGKSIKPQDETFT